MVAGLLAILSLACGKVAWKVDATGISPSREWVYRVEVRRDPISLNTDFTRVVVAESSGGKSEVVFQTTGLPKVKACWMFDHVLAIAWEPLLEADGSEGTYIRVQEGGALREIRIRYYRMEEQGWADWCQPAPSSPGRR